MTRREALDVLAARGEAPRHVTSGMVSQGHGHIGVCCCVTALCMSDACNVNAVIVAS